MAKRPSAPVLPDAAAGAIIKALTPLTYGRSAGQVFDDWLEITEASLVMLPYHAHSIAEGKGCADDPEWVQAIWARLRAVYDRQGWERLSEAFAHLLCSSGTPTGDRYYQDVVGDMFTQFGTPNNWAGQYFTPYDVALLMAQMTLNPAEVVTIVHERLRRALFAVPGGEALLMAWTLALGSSQDEGTNAFCYFAEHIFPIVRETYQPYTIADPCCGSGVMLVATMAVLPAWLTQYGLVAFHATDIDARCVRMAHINLMLHGAASYVVRHQDSLTLAPDFTPPRIGRVQWQERYINPTDPALAHLPALPRPTAPSAPPALPPPDVVLDITTLTQLTFDL